MAKGSIFLSMEKWNFPFNNNRKPHYKLKCPFPFPQDPSANITCRSSIDKCYIMGEIPFCHLCCEDRQEKRGVNKDGEQSDLIYKSKLELLLPNSRRRDYTEARAKEKTPVHMSSLLLRQQLSARYPLFTLTTCEVCILM